MMRLLLPALLGIHAVVASADREASDTLVLAQRSYHVTPAVIEPGPSGGDVALLALSTAAPEAAQIDGPEDFLRSLGELINSTSKGSKTARQPDLTAFMKFFQAMTEAVRSDAFMGNMTRMYHTWLTDTKAYGHKVLAAVKEYTVLSRTAEDEEMSSLTALAFNNVTNLTLELNSLMHKALDVAGDAIPAVMQETMETVIDGGFEEGNTVVLKLMPSNLNQSELCVQADRRLVGVRKSADETSQLLGFMNSSMKMMPMLRDYLQTSKPDVAARMMYLTEDYLDSLYAIYADDLDTFELVLSDVKPVVKERLGCELTGAGARRGLGLLALLLAAAAWLGR
mmetsp:Transcript_26117/g.74880  ORF Transcript_26117/g.74880 Transcript_26117/m.74880 type:complete len:339 (+) Transcript_26117:87-1103(+)